MPAANRIPAKGTLVAKPPLVVVPGLAARGDTYTLALKPLRERFDVRVAETGLDFPPRLGWGFFESAIDAAAGDVRTFQLLGHSLGASIALHYAAKHPERVTQVVASSAVLFPFHRAAVPFRRLKGLLKCITSGHPGHFFEALRTRRLMLADGRAAKYYDFAGRIDLTKQLPKLRHATVLYPEREEVIPLAHFHRLQRDYPHIKTRLIPGEHNDLALNPRRLNRIIAEELDD